MVVANSASGALTPRLSDGSRCTPLWVCRREPKHGEEEWIQPGGDRKSLLRALFWEPTARLRRENGPELNPHLHCIKKTAIFSSKS